MHDLIAQMVRTSGKLGLCGINTRKVYETQDMRTESRVASKLREPKVSDTLERYTVSDENT
jgi:hypothetical protein